MQEHLWKKPSLFTVSSISRPCLINEHMIRDTFSYQFRYKSSRARCGSSNSHTFGKALSNSYALTLLSHTNNPVLPFFDGWTRQVGVAGILLWCCPWGAGSPGRALAVGRIPGATPTSILDPLRKREVGHGKECGLFVHKGMDKAILQRQTCLFNFFGSIQNTRGTTASQGELSSELAAWWNILRCVRVSSLHDSH